MKIWSLFAILGLFWGGSFVAIKLVVEVLPPLLAATLRVGIALVALTAIYRGFGKSRFIPRQQRAQVWLAALFSQTIPFAFLFWAETRVSPGMAGIVNGTLPLWTSFIGYIFLRKLEHFNARAVAGLALGFLGIGIVYFPTLSSAPTASELLPLGALLGMVISYAIGGLMNRRLLHGGVDLYASTYHQLCASFLFLGLLCALSGQLQYAGSTFKISALLGVVYLGICSTALAWMIYYFLIKEWGAVRASSVTYLMPPAALFLDYLFFGRIPTDYSVFGSVFILAGVFLIHSKAEKPAASR
jgi:drug/metabolite transporter (DMT)-like permease